VSRVTFFGAPTAPFARSQGSRDDPGEKPPGFCPVARNNRLAGRCLTQTPSANHIRAQKKSIPFPGNPGPSQDESGCFFWGVAEPGKTTGSGLKLDDSRFSRLWAPLEAAEAAAGAQRAAWGPRPAGLQFLAAGADERA
jgi:hypothetical protein